MANVLRESLVRAGPIWRASLPVGGKTLWIMITAGAKGPDHALIALAESVIVDVARLEGAARVFIRDYAPEYATKVLTLAGLDFQYPDAGWMPNGGVVPLDEPMFGLQFQIAGDRNVLDVNFVNGQPIEADYH